MMNRALMMKPFYIFSLPPSSILPCLFSSLPRSSRPRQVTPPPCPFPLIEVSAKVDKLTVNSFFPAKYLCRSSISGKKERKKEEEIKVRKTIKYKTFFAKLIFFFSLLLICIKSAEGRFFIFFFLRCQIVP